MNLLLEVKEMLGRRRMASLVRSGVQPEQGKIEIEEDGTFWVEPNFYYLEGVRWKYFLPVYPPVDEGRPRWLPLYPTPQLVPGAHVTFGWPSEGLTELGNKVHVVGQAIWTRERDLADTAKNLRNEHVIGGWLRGDFEHSALWDCVIIPSGRLRGAMTAQELGLRWDARYNGYQAWANDLWLGNHGPHFEHIKRL